MSSDDLFNIIDLELKISADHHNIRIFLRGEGGFEIQFASVNI